MARWNANICLRLCDRKSVIGVAPVWWKALGLSVGGDVLAPAFVLKRGQLVQYGVSTMRVVPALDELQDGDAAAAWLWKRAGSDSAHSRVAKKDAHIALP